MKTLTQPQRMTGMNAWNAITTRVEQDMRIEKDDVGIERPHYLGFNHRTYTFKNSDVGRTITIYSDGWWTCWSFKS